MSENNRLRLICLVYPTGCSEDALLAGKGSLSIIGSEQYLLIKRYLSETYDVILYTESLVREKYDILLILNCMPLVSDKIITQFERVIYFFDDINIWKLQTADYNGKSKVLSAMFHPVKSIGAQLAEKSRIPTFFLPWSLSRFPQLRREQTVKPSFFIDMDGRPPYVESIQAGFAFVASLTIDCDAIYVPDAYVEQAPPAIRSRITGVPFMAHDDFLALLGHVWFYVSGINGSYEFPALEASFMGCGLISLRSALLDAHRGGTFYMEETAEPEPQARLKAMCEAFDREIVIGEAHVRYPQDYPRRIPSLLQQIFPTIPA